MQTLMFLSWFGDHWSTTHPFVVRRFQLNQPTTNDGLRSQRISEIARSRPDSLWSVRPESGRRRGPPHDRGTAWERGRDLACGPASGLNLSRSGRRRRVGRKLHYMRVLVGYGMMCVRVHIHEARGAHPPHTVYTIIHMANIYIYYKRGVHRTLCRRLLCT